MNQTKRKRPPLEHPTTTENHEGVRRPPPPPMDLALLLQMALGTREPLTGTGCSLRGLDPLIGFRRRELGAPPTAEQRRALAKSATTWALLEQTLTEVGRTLTAVDIPFVLIKGAAACPLYPLPELRPTSDLDLLIHHRDLDDARRALSAQGWRSAVKGRYAEDYLQDEGSCWQAYRQGRVVVEVHFRFWGSVTSDFHRSVLTNAKPRADGFRVPSLSHQLIIAAAHAARQPRPRRAVDLLDICLLLLHSESTAFRDLARDAKSSGQSLPVTLALDIAASVLNEAWPQAALRNLEDSLRLSERRVLARGRRFGQDSVPWWRIRLAMLLARRPSRAGLRSILRRVWPHPGVVEQRTSPHRSWPARRLSEFGRAARGLWPGK